MKKTVALWLFYFFIITVHGQNVGIGTTSPKAAFNVAAGNTVLFGNDTITVGNKFIYYGDKVALRLGIVNPNDSIGNFSTGLGIGSIASGRAAFSSGYYNQATGYGSHAIGESNFSSYGNTIAIGSKNQATGLGSIAIGGESVSTGVMSLAIGNDVTASGNFSTAMGNIVNTNGYVGSFIIGDRDPTGQGVTFCGISNQFVARFANGYYFLTSGDAIRTGVQIGAGGNAWLSISDKNRKENFETVNDENILKKLSAITYSSWNYKGQDPKTFRHYGIMAQDFYQAFGKDTFGTIGSDTLVNPVDMQGIAFSAIKALEIRTQKIDALQEQIMELKKIVALLQKQIALSGPAFKGQ